MVKTKIILGLVMDTLNFIAIETENPRMFLVSKMKSNPLNRCTTYIIFHLYIFYFVCIYYKFTHIVERNILNYALQNKTLEEIDR